MVLAWRKWCGLCGAVPETPFLDLRGRKELLDVAVRCFSLSLERNGGLHACDECLEFVENIRVFGEKCSLVREMFGELKKNFKIKEDGEMLEYRKSFLDGQSTQGVKLERIALKAEQQPILSEEPPPADCKTENVVEQEEEELIEDCEGEEEDVVEPWPLFEVDEVQEEEEDEEEDQDIEEEGEEVDEEDEEEHEVKHRKSPKKKSDERARCNACQLVFRFKYQLKAHNEKKHPGMKPYICETCGKSFKNMKCLDTHSAVHIKTSLQCNLCPKIFKSERRLQMHQKLHSKDKWVCPQCGVVLNSRNTFLRHMNVHSDEKNFKCTICGKLFKRHKTLKEHLIIHSGLRPYKCPFCERTFVNGANCRSHKLKNHPEEVAALEASGMNEAVLAECRNIPRIDELIAVSLQRMNGGEVHVDPELLKVRTAGRPYHDGWTGYTRKQMGEGDKLKPVAECDGCRAIIYPCEKKKMLQHKTQCMEMSQNPASGPVNAAGSRAEVAEGQQHQYTVQIIH